MHSRREFIGSLAATMLTAAEVNLEALMVEENPIPSSEQTQSQRLDALKKQLDKEGYGTSFFSDPRFKVDETSLKYSNRVSSEKITYAAYKARLGVDLLKIRGEGFVEKNQDVLAAAQLATEVDQNYLAAIIGIESRFATFTGDHLAANALAALALSTRERMKNLGLNEIRSLLAYCDKHNLRFEREEKGKRQEYTGPFVPSSWAGALGYFQFLPSNLEKLAISAEPGRNPNPFHIPDCLHSIGNYFNKAGWSRKEARSAPAKDSRNWKAIYAYNHSNHYVQAVVEIAEHLRAKQKT